MATGFPGLTASPFTAPASWPELGDATANIRRAGLAPLEAQQQQQPVQRTARLAYSPSQKQFFVGGYTFDDDNDTAAVTMSKYANQEAPLPEGDWQEIDPAAYAQYVQSIRDPNTLTLMAKNFGMGVDEMQQMAGLGLQWLGAESAGQYLADQGADLQRNQVYSRNFTDIGSSPENGVLDWMAATIGRLGPNVVESTISAGIGAAIGGAVSGPAAPAGAPIGAIAGFFGKTAVKKALLEAAKKRLKGEALDAAEKKLLLSAGAMTNAAATASKTRLMSPAAVAGFIDEATLTGAQAVGGQVARRAAQVGGAAGLSTASNIFQQTGQAYGETMAGGGEGDRAVALGVGVLGGLADTIPEFILAGRLFSELGGDVVSAAKKRKSAMDLLKGAASGRTGRIAGYAGAGAAIEGATEGFQEVLQIAANPILDLGSAEASNRVVNAFAAGALMGGVMGGAGGGFAGSLANNKQEANLLLPVSQSDPAFAQYREDLKAQIGEKPTNEIYPPMAPQVMGARPTRAEFDAARKARMDAITGMGTLRGFAGQPPVPLSAGEPTTFQAPQAQPFVPSAERGTPLPGMSGVATGTLPKGVTPTVFPGQPLPTPPAPSAPQTISMGGTMTPGQMGGMGTFEQFQAAAMQQAMAAQQAAPPAPVPPSVQELRGVGIPQPAAAGAAPLPGGESINARLLRRGAIPQAAPPAQQRTPRQVVEQGPLRMAGQATGVQVPTVVPKVTDTTLPSFSVARLRRGMNNRFGHPNNKKRVDRAIEAIRDFASKFPADAQALRDNIDKVKVLVVGGTADPARQAQDRKDLDLVISEGYDANNMRDPDFGQAIERLQNYINDYSLATRDMQAMMGDVLSPSMPSIDVSDMVREALGVQNGIKPGAGTGSATPAGKQGSQDGGPSAGDNLRAGAATTREEPAPKAQRTPSGGKPLQAEADVPPAVEVKVGKRQADGTRLVTLPDGRTATIYYDSDSKVWRIERPKGYIPKAQSQPGYISDALGSKLEEAKQNVVEVLDRMEAAVAEAKAANDQTLKRGTEGKKPTDLQQFLNTYADPRSFGGMRENENLADVVEYADWLGSLSKAELAKIEPVFSKRDNPFLNAGSMDVARARAKLEEAISPKAPEVAATSAKTAAEPELTETKAEAKARKAAEAKRVKDIGRVNKAIVDANNAEADERITSLAAVARLGADEKLSPEARALAQDHIATELSELETILLNARLADLGYKDLSPDDKAELAADAIRGSDAVDPNAVPKSELDEVYSAIATVRQQTEEMKALAGKGNDTPAKREAFKKNFLSLMSWAKAPGISEQAQWTARAYLEEYKGRTSQDWAGVEQAFDDIDNGRYMLSTFDLVENPIDENGRPAKGVNPIRVKAIVDKFRSGLAKAPTFHVYKNQADLQRRNPTLYQQAVGSRPQGDFDAVRASGFAFDGKVLVFTDRVPTEKYMRLLLAHESIGHFGMRSLLPAKQFDALMDYVYDNNAKLRLKVDAQLAGNTDLGARREAVEEYMAKNAERLDSSIITRVWNAIKDVLNKLGIKFEDDIVRYLVSQARRTVREGSSAFTPSTFALNVHTVTTNNGTGRFSTEPIYTAQHAMRNRLAIMDAQPANLGEVKQALKDWKVTSADLLEVMTRNVFRLRNYNALRNHGAQAFEYLKDAMRSAAQTLRNVYNERLGTMLALTGESRRAFSNAMVVSRRIADRRFALDKELRNAALLTLGDEQPDGFRELTVNEPVLKRLIELGTLSKDELDNGAEVTYEEPDANGKIVKTKVKIPGVKELVGRELTKEEYDLYVKTRKDLADLDIERLKGQYQNFLATEKVTTKGIRKVLADKNMTDDDVAFVRNIVNHAKKLFIDDIDYDERGIPAVTPETAVRMEQYFKAINTAVVKREFTDDLKAEVRKFYLPKPKKGETVAADTTNKAADAAIKRIEEFRSRRTEFTGREEQGVIYTLQDRVKEIVLADAAFDKAQMAVRRSIASSHVPLWREGSWQVRVEAQINGKPVKLHPEVQNKMLFSLSENVAGAENDAKFFNDSMKDVEYSGLVYNEENGEYKTQKFTLFARPSKAVESVASDPSIDIDNFLYTLRVLGQPLTPDKHAKAITMLTAPGSALRKALRFDDTPGYDPDKSVEAIARHVTTRSSLIARTRFQPFMRELMNLSTDSGKRWFGDAEVVMDAKDNLDKATTDKAKAYWQDRLTTELYKYVTTNPGAKGWDGSRAKFVSRPEKADLGMRDYSDAVKELEWLMDSANISESTFEGKRLAALAKMVTSVGFLGGMFTQFAQNLMSPATNVMPFLASKDSQTGFGGGFGMAVMPTYLKAFKDVVGLRGLNPFTDPIKDAEAFENIANTIKVARDTKDTAKEAELVQQYGLSYYEALNIAREIREGKLIPAQANAMLETARGIFTGTASKLWLKFSDIYMSPFNVSEQATRRATFLTAFRLEFDRLKQAGFNEDKASELARMFAIDTVDKTLGEYSNTNRPPVWRDGWQSLLFVYKTYPLTSLLLFKNMSRAGKIGMLTALWVLAGAAGFPLVDDMEDLIDTLSQRMGLDLGQGPSIRMAIINQLEEVFPGWSDFILRGPMNHFTGADVGAKFGLEDFIPGTGILLKGANTTEELKDIAGPVLGMGLSMGKFAYDAIRAPLSSTVSAVDVARESPFSLMRAGGDVAAYLQNGAIVDRRGYVVTPEVSAMTLAARLLGFYPAKAAKQYDFIKYANRMNYDYKEVGMAYKLAWIKAKKTGNEREAARIVREVNEWNEANRGGPGFIRNFLKNAQRQLKEANRPAGERFLKAAPVTSRAEYDRFLEYITGE